jgi:hypothetical protein
MLKKYPFYRTFPYEYPLGEGGNVLFRNKCSACDYWTIFELKIEGEEALKICTHCQDQTRVPSVSQLELKVRDGEKDVKVLEKHFPALAKLKKPGDHVKIS